MDTPRLMLILALICGLCDCVFAAGAELEGGAGSVAMGVAVVGAVTAASITALAARLATKRACAARRSRVARLLTPLTYLAPLLNRPAERQRP